MKVLLVEDEPKIAAFVQTGLTDRGMQVRVVDDGRAGYECGLQAGLDAIVLDLMLPGRDGLDVLAAWRREGVQTPVILLTARNELGDRLQGLALGADDYLAKPFFIEELAARLLTIRRRLNGERQHLLQVGDLTLDRIARAVRWSDRQVELTSREFNLLEFLMRSTGQVFSRTQILEHVWGYDFDPSTNVIDVCVKRIRARLSQAGAIGERAPSIEAVRGVGYRFCPPAHADGSL
ncbi:response regulator transcription factor [Pelomonas sp. V22]|uniref:response regulator transcription factor n=1 Tax=Pelomonas sp. V22 TaxID=2822139 RepID=UPI0024A85589|nr:response regulator transcription factor [Pelomonas sp. V22]MDI4634561.1 response regulator transcription factor [Pelomonas sp. V22]